jgi:hypothetical protein
VAQSTQQASNLYNAQQSATAQTIADILAQGDALKGDAAGRIAGGTQGFYSGGTPGYTVDNRGAVNGQYNTIRDDVTNVFDQAVGAIKGQAPQINTDFQNKINLIAQIAAQQNAAASQQSAQQLSDQQSAAARMGIDAAPQTGRASNIAGALGLARNAGADAQKGYFGAMKGFALSRNTSQADAFGYANSQQQQKIEAARQAALAKAVYWVPGSRGKFTATYGSADKKADRSLISGITKTQKAITASSKSEAAQRAKDPTIRQSAVQANRRLN